MDEATKKEVEAMIAGAIGPVTDRMGQLADVVKPVGAMKSQLDELGKSVGVIADTLKSAPPVQADKLKELVGQTISEQQAAAQKAAAKAKAKADWLEKNAPKLPAIYRRQIPETEDGAEIEKAGKAALEEWTKDSGGIAGGSAAAPGENGKAPGSEAPKAKAVGGVSEGVAKFAASIRLPGTPAPESGK